MTRNLTLPVGPILFLDDLCDDEAQVSALFVTGPGEEPAPIETGARTFRPAELARYDRGTVWRTRFRLPTGRASEYCWNGERFEVALDLSGDLRLGYVSCNGEEVGDMERAQSERNAMWERLCSQHRKRPLALLLHGGDQLYADELTQGHPLSDGWPDRIPRDPGRADLVDLRHYLRERFFERYVALLAAPPFAWLGARVPSLMQWDDHDICDGWGSLRRSRTYNPVGQTLFTVAREGFLVFQQAARDVDLPPRFLDRDGVHLGWTVHGPGLRIVAPDLRSERTRRDIMGAAGWQAIEAEARRDFEGHTFLMSSVPLLGPRLSLLELLMVSIPRMQKYEDDLRDQWQSRAHRDEWRRMLRIVRDMARRDGHGITAISGEIHLAARAVMDLGQGLELHQLTASGIAHRPPPKGWARVLGALAWLGEDPLPEHPIRIPPLPGQKARYVAERNYLLLERTNSKWQARWDLERSGMTAPLNL
ncbi:PhoD-like phosphatase [Ruegeria intermedia]|uniref:PhoD-like phosphatase n=1 Tax=Ruegeria intermedia TaxID=996115 RepID=A0A1M5BXF3_9RHOB|nr:alkaline phosphatase D family protein [Ruegeria intermedia]SHF46892.1 PhoD-like phosphatase [Ruegeria intermedia]